MTYVPRWLPYIADPKIDLIIETSKEGTRLGGLTFVCEGIFACDMPSAEFSGT